MEGIWKPTDSAVPAGTETQSEPDINMESGSGRGATIPRTQPQRSPEASPIGVAMDDDCIIEHIYEEVGPQTTNGRKDHFDVPVCLLAGRRNSGGVRAIIA